MLVVVLYCTIDHRKPVVGADGRTTNALVVQVKVAGGTRRRKQISKIENIDRYYNIDWGHDDIKKTYNK